MKSELKEQETILEASIAEGKSHVERVRELEQTLDTTNGKLSQLSTEYGELESAYETVRVELASNRVPKADSLFA